MPVGVTRRVRLECKDLNSSSRELFALAELLGINREMGVI
jgi:hypothetical protein